MKRILLLALGLMLSATPIAQGEELRMGFMTTLTGGGAPLGVEMKRGWDLGLENQGWEEDGDELAGVPTTVLIGDDQRQPEVGLEIVNRWLREHRTQIVAGFVWSNIILAARRPVIRNRSILLSTNAGANDLSGEGCSRYFISTSWRSAQNSEATGAIMNERGVESVYAMAPNYQAGKDYVDGLQRTFDGEFLGQTLFPLGASDFQSELARVREADPSALFVFAPGSMGIAFLRQWHSSGLADEVELYGVYVVDQLSLGAHGESALGTFHTDSWSTDLDTEATRSFVRDFVAAHGREPAFVAAQAYDAVNLIASAVRAVDGEVNDTLAMMREMRKANFDSVRGPFTYEPNGIPRQNWYLFKVERGPEGEPTINTVRTVFEQREDVYADRCPERERIQVE